MKALKMKNPEKLATKLDRKAAQKARVVNRTINRKSVWSWKWGEDMTSKRGVFA